MVQYRVWVGRVGARLAEGGDRGPVGARADEDLADVLFVDLGVRTEVEINLLGEAVDEKVKKLVLVDFTVCLLVGVHILSKLTF
jgi:hypothetical protein